MESSELLQGHFFQCFVADKFKCQSVFNQYILFEVIKIFKNNWKKNSVSEFVINDLITLFQQIKCFGFMDL